MLRNVYLQGELGERYGEKRQIDADSFIDVINCLSANFDDFRSYFAECLDKDIYFAFKISNKVAENAEDFFIPLQEGDIIITPVPAGEGKLGKALGAALGIVLMVASGGLAAPVGAALGLGAKGTAVVGGLFKMLGTNMFNSNVQKLLAEDPSADTEQDPSYLFTGSDQNISSDDPVPICYGRLRVPSRPVSFEVRVEDEVQYSI